MFSSLKALFGWSGSNTNRSGTLDGDDRKDAVERTDSLKNLDERNRIYSNINHGDMEDISPHEDSETLAKRRYSSITVDSDDAPNATPFRGPDSNMDDPFFRHRDYNNSQNTSPVSVSHTGEPDSASTRFYGSSRESKRFRREVTPSSSYSPIVPISFKLDVKGHDTNSSAKETPHRNDSSSTSFGPEAQNIVKKFVPLVTQVVAGGQERLTELEYSMFLRILEANRPTELPSNTDIDSNGNNINNSKSSNVNVDLSVNQTPLISTVINPAHPSHGIYGKEVLSTPRETIESGFNPSINHNGKTAVSQPISNDSSNSKSSSLSYGIGTHKNNSFDIESMAVVTSATRVASPAVISPSSAELANSTRQEDRLRKFSEAFGLGAPSCASSISYGSRTPACTDVRLTSPIKVSLSHNKASVMPFQRRSKVVSFPKIETVGSLSAISNSGNNSIVGRGAEIPGPTISSDHKRARPAIGVSTFELNSLSSRPSFLDRRISAQVTRFLLASGGKTLVHDRSINKEIINTEGNNSNEDNNRSSAASNPQSHPTHENTVIDRDNAESEKVTNYHGESGSRTDRGRDNEKNKLRAKDKNREKDRNRVKDRRREQELRARSTSNDFESNYTKTEAEISENSSFEPNLKSSRQSSIDDNTSNNSNNSIFGYKSYDKDSSSFDSIFNNNSNDHSSNHNSNSNSNSNSKNNKRDIGDSRSERVDELKQDVSIAIIDSSSAGKPPNNLAENINKVEMKPSGPAKSVSSPNTADQIFFSSTTNSDQTKNSNVNVGPSIDKNKIDILPSTVVPLSTNQSVDAKPVIEAINNSNLFNIPTKNSSNQFPVPTGLPKESSLIFGRSKEITPRDTSPREDSIIGITSTSDIPRVESSNISAPPVGLSFGVSNIFNTNNSQPLSNSTVSVSQTSKTKNLFEPLGALSDDDDVVKKSKPSLTISSTSVLAPTLPTSFTPAPNTGATQPPSIFGTFSSSIVAAPTASTVPESKPVTSLFGSNSTTTPITSTPNIFPSLSKDELSSKPNPNPNPSSSTTNVASNSLFSPSTANPFGPKTAPDPIQTVPSTAVVFGGTNSLQSTSTNPFINGGDVLPSPFGAKAPPATSAAVDTLLAISKTPSAPLPRSDSSAVISNTNPSSQSGPTTAAANTFSAAILSSSSGVSPSSQPFVFGGATIPVPTTPSLSIGSSTNLAPTNFFKPPASLLGDFQPSSGSLQSSAPASASSVQIAPFGNSRAPTFNIGGQASSSDFGTNSFMTSNIPSQPFPINSNPASKIANQINNAGFGALDSKSNSFMSQQQSSISSFTNTAPQHPTQSVLTFGAQPNPFMQPSHLQFGGSAAPSFNNSIAPSGSFNNSTSFGASNASSDNGSFSHGVTTDRKIVRAPRGGTKR